MIVADIFCLMRTAKTLQSLYKKEKPSKWTQRCDDDDDADVHF